MMERGVGLVHAGLPLDHQTEVTADWLIEQRKLSYRRLVGRTSGADVLGTLTARVDGVVAGCFRNTARQEGPASAEIGFEQTCLVAVGEYGRRELTPYSDIEMMLLTRSDQIGGITAFAQRFSHRLLGAGISALPQVRTVPVCIESATTAVELKTALMEARFLAGSEEFFYEFHRRFTRCVVARGVGRFIDALAARRRRDDDECGASVSALEPHVLKGRGGLRDLHRIRWIGMARYGVATIEELADRGTLSTPDAQALTEAQDFLWRARMLLHLDTKTTAERLSFDLQVRLATALGFRDRPHLLAVEDFMRRYYRHTLCVHEIFEGFIARCRPVPLVERVRRLAPAPRIAGHYVVRSGALDIPRRWRSRVMASPVLLLRFFEIARSRTLSIDSSVLDDMRCHMETLPAEAFRAPEAAGTFLRILSGPGAAKTLAAMHRAHLLEQVIPVLARVRGLRPFTRSHHYPVDQHCLLAVAQAEALQQDAGIIGEAYRTIPHKAVLHLALLLHDLGKGQDNDHSDVGAQIADEVGTWLGLAEPDRWMLVFLAQHHLLLSHVALGPTVDEEQALVRFVQAVGTPDVLRALLVLTVADCAAGGPGLFTKWHASLLVDWYRRALSELSGEGGGTGDAGWLNQVARDVAREPVLSCASAMDESWIVSQLRQMPSAYIYRTLPHNIAGHLAAIRQLHPGGVLAQSEFVPDSGTCEYTVITFDDLIPGMFSKMAGVLAAHRLQILDARIHTKADGIVVDTFQVIDPDYPDAPPAERRAAIVRSLVSVLKGEVQVEDLMKRSANRSAQPRSAIRRPTEVRVDQVMSDCFTILDVCADDWQGILYVMAEAIFRLGLSVHHARISTRLDQAADVFFVTDLAGRKIEDSAQLDRIRIGLHDAIERFLDARPTEQKGC